MGRLASLRNSRVDLQLAERQDKIGHDACSVLRWWTGSDVSQDMLQFVLRQCL